MSDLEKRVVELETALLPCRLAVAHADYLYRELEKIESILTDAVYLVSEGSHKVLEARRAARVALAFVDEQRRAISTEGGS